MSKSLIITGASRGIGAATAVLAGERGWKVCVNYNSSPAKAEAVVETIKASGGEAFAIQGNAGSARCTVMARGAGRTLSCLTSDSTSPPLIATPPQNHFAIRL